MLRSCVSGVWVTAVAVAMLVATPDVTAQSQHEGAGLTRTASARQPTALPAASTTDDSSSGWTFAATLEGFYEWNFNEPPDRINLLRAYDTRANTFALQQVALVLERPVRLERNERLGLRVDLQFGLATETVQGSALNEPRPDVYRHVWQAFGSYVFPLGRGIRMDFGKFASSLGYETNYAKDNDHFSRALLFNFLPFYHNGVRTTFPVNDRLTLMHTLTNGIQQTEDFNNFKSNHFSATLTPVAQVSWTINYYLGHERFDAPSGAGDALFQVFDTYASFRPTDRLSFAFDANRVTGDASSVGALVGLGAYFRYQFTKSAAAAYRYERLDDEPGLFGGVPQLLRESTATLEYKFADGFAVRGEFRRDWSNRVFFPARAPDGLRKSQSTVLIGLIWWAGGKTGSW